MTLPRICVTVTARTADGCRAAIAAAAVDGADLAEIRFDRWAEGEWRRAKELFPAPVPLLATYRSVAEGGEGSVDPGVREEILESLRRLPFERVDRERARDPAPDGPSSARSVGSRHLSAPVDWASLAELAESGVASGEIGKVVAPATIREFLGPMRGALAGAPPGAIHLATGPAGPLSRVRPDWLGSAWVFAAPGPHDPFHDRPVEPGQVPVDRLRSVLADGAPGPLFAVIGHPVDHSESPAIHHRWMRAARRPGAYIALDVETERELRDLLERLGPAGFRGLNVTHPWKALARSASRRSEAPADEAGAANCLTWGADGWSAALTDVEAAGRRLAELRSEGRWDGGELIVLGSGSAARATIVAARSLGAWVRVRARASGAVEELHRRFPETVRGAASAPSSLVVHATSAGRAGGPALAFPVRDLLGPGTHLLDFVYGPSPGALASEAAAAGASYEDGRRLLRYQAEESYRRWWGEAPPSDAPEERP